MEEQDDRRISLGWATVVGLLGYEDMRPWGSCFLQYLWEFVLEMWLADKYIEKPERFSIDNANWGWILCGEIIGVGLTGSMGWKGGRLKLYNDIPSLVAYMSCLLSVYKLGSLRISGKAIEPFAWINKFFIWASSFGYELYLVHSLVYTIMWHFLPYDLGDGKLALWLWICVMFAMAYMVALGYSWILKKTIYRR